MENFFYKIYFNDKEQNQIFFKSGFEFKHFVIEIFSNTNGAGINFLTKDSIKGTAIADINYSCFEKILVNISKTYGKIFFSRSAKTAQLCCFWDLKKIDKNNIFIMHNEQAELKFKITYAEIKWLNKWAQILLHCYRIRDNE